MLAWVMNLGFAAGAAAAVAAEPQVFRVQPIENIVQKFSRFTFLLGAWRAFFNY